MSRIGMWPLVVEDVRARARAAAGTADPGSWLDAYRDLCAELGEEANFYACPEEAARALVSVAAPVFLHELRKARV